MESLWTGTVYVPKKKKDIFDEIDATGPGTKKKKSKASANEEEETSKTSKKSSAKKKTTEFDGETSAKMSANPWDFDEAMGKLKANRKAIGGSAFDIAVMSDEDRILISVPMSV